MKSIIESELFIIFINFGAYVLSSFLMDKLKIKFMNALLPAVALVITIVLTLGIDYSVYEAKSELISFFLGPCVVALGYVLHKHIDTIKGNLTPIIIAILVGALVNIIIINLTCLYLGVDSSITYSLHPKSVTTPIAMSLSEQNKGIVALTVLVVVFTGIFGSTFGSAILKILKITNPVSKGLALGSASHAIGTARAFELGATEGAMGGLAIGLMGAISSLVIPILKNLFLG